MISINQIIRQYAYDHKISLKKVASTMGITHQALYKLLSTPDFTLSRLHQISQALNHNFFQYYITTPATPANDPIHLQHEIDRLTTKVAHLQHELALKNEIIQLLKASSSEA